MTDERKRLLGDALIAGVVGYGVVVLFFALLSVVQGRSPFHTAALLGGALFGSVADPTAVVVEPGVVLAFNGVHLLGFLLMGLFAAWLMYETELHPQFWYLSFVLFVAAVLGSYAAVLAATVFAGTLVAPWVLVVPAVLGAVAMAGYLAGAHRSLLRAIRSNPDPDVA